MNCKDNTKSFETVVNRLKIFMKELLANEVFAANGVK